MKKNIEIHIETNNKNRTGLDNIIDRAIKMSEEICEKIDNSNEISSSNLECSKRQSIDLRNLTFSQPHLDIGGGGESIIYKISKRDITIIDLDFDDDKYNKRAKIYNMDARSMSFKDNSFNLVTIFYTLLYIKDTDLIKVLKEVYRVLNKNGEIYIWDVNMKSSNGNFVEAPLLVHSDSFNIKVTYASNNVESVRDAQYYFDALVKVGFSNIEIKENASSVFIVARKI